MQLYSVQNRNVQIRVFFFDVQWFQIASCLNPLLQNIFHRYSTYCIKNPFDAYLAVSYPFQTPWRSGMRMSSRPLENPPFLSANSRYPRRFVYSHMLSFTVALVGFVPHILYGIDVLFSSPPSPSVPGAATAVTPSDSRGTTSTCWTRATPTPEPYSGWSRRPSLSSGWGRTGNISRGKKDTDDPSNRNTILLICRQHEWGHILTAEDVRHQLVNVTFLSGDGPAGFLTIDSASCSLFSLMNSLASVGELSRDMFQQHLDFAIDHWQDIDFAKDLFIYKG